MDKAVSFYLKVGFVDGAEWISKTDNISLVPEFQNILDILEGLVDDLETPHRLGLGDYVNPYWTNYNRAKEALKKY